MTADRDPDRLLRAWLDLMPDEAPDRVIASVLQATTAAPQARALPWLGPRRFHQMNRLSLVAAAAAVLVALIGGAYLLSTGGPKLAAPTQTPSPTTLPSALGGPGSTPLADLSRFGLGRGMGYPTTLPASFRDAAWIADVDAIQGLFHDTRIRMSSTANGQQLVIQYGQTQPSLLSQAVTGAAEYVSLLSLEPGSGCATGDFGDYATRSSQDGLSVSFMDPRDETCATRRSLLGRTWTRSLETRSNGGRGVLTMFNPMLVVTLPDAAFTADNGTASTNLSANSIDRTFIAVQNPTGFTDPCAQTGGSKIGLDNTIDGFVRYITALPGFTLGPEDFFKIDGHDAAHVVIPTSAAGACPSGAYQGRVMEWGTSNRTEPGGWFLAQGDTDVIYLVQVGKDLFLLQWLGTGVTAEEEQAVLSTVHFIDALPTTP